MPTKLKKETSKTKVTRQNKTKKAQENAEFIKEDIKETTTNCSCNNELLSFDMLIHVWLQGWKQTFNLKGRTSLFELWSFMLINGILSTALQLCCHFILSDTFLKLATINEIPLSRIEDYILAANFGFYTALILPLLPLLTLLIRRMHDIGELAWEKYIEPLLMGTVVLLFINISLDSLSNTDFVYTTILLSTCFITILYSVGFYSLKFLIKTLFMRGQTTDNQYGKVSYNEREFNETALNYSCIYFLLQITILCLYLSLLII